MSGPAWPAASGRAWGVSSAVMTLATLAVGSGFAPGLASRTFRASTPTAASPWPGQASEGRGPRVMSAATTCSAETGENGRLYAATRTVGISTATTVAAGSEIFNEGVDIV